MLKIWLTWLQPSLGVLGTALVLSNPLCSIATPILSATPRISKAPTQTPQWSTVKSSIGTSLNQNLLKGIPATPDLAVRQLAINTMATSGMPAIATTARSTENFDPLSNFTGTTTKFQQFSAKATKPQQMKQPITAALIQASKPQPKTIVPGLAIGTSEVRVSERVLPTVKPTLVASTAPVQVLSAAPAKTVATPYPVVNPELMGKLQAAPAIATVTNIKTPSQYLNFGAISTGLPKAVDTTNPVASIPAGLQQLLGNNFDSSQKVIVLPVAKATGPNFRSMAALNQLVSPSEKIAPATVSMTSLQLATAQSYSNVPKFSIPGEPTAAKPIPAAVEIAAKSTPKTATIATIAGKNNNYVSLIGNRSLTPMAGQSWTVVSQSSQLGGLILGSQQLATLPKAASLLAVQTSTFTGQTMSDLGNIN
jgi:hypothetical protein